MTIYQELGGGEAIQTALDVFYEKVMADPRVSVYFDDVDVDRVKVKQKAFLTLAFGGEAAYDGRDLGAAHQSAVAKGLDDDGFDVFMGHFRDTLDELGVDGTRTDEILAMCYDQKDEVLGG